MQKRWAWAVFGAFAVHNLEEALTAPAFFNDLPPDLPIPWPSAAAFQIATAVVTLIGLALILFAIRINKTWPVTLLATVMLINVAIPHIPAAILNGGYAPGVVTAVLLNLPIDLLWLLKFRKQRPGVN
ncbi:HXXEE domain-containing protein [Glycomyces dulcitolivorans]|uniref:HXXEE domain-containing protein n=1 Tax=Glycomyces dulcitolivorans TaxID=2200759 RepID=UPI000DD48188|nr:HXXEE domain-containing protein [Glycomyces dulcitolivorans]